MKYTLFLLALPLAAQVVIDAGSSTDRGFSGGYAFKSDAMSSLPAPYRDLRAGSAFSYDVAVPNGTCMLTLSLVENRPAGPDPAQNSAPGSRVFAVSANGLSTGPLDLFQLVGPLTPYSRPLGPVIVSDGHLRISFQAARGNAVVSGIRADCTPTPAPPLSLEADGWHFHGDLHIDGDLYIKGFAQTGTPGQPTHFAVTDSAGKVCDLTFDAGKPLLTCP